MLRLIDRAHALISDSVAYDILSVYGQFENIGLQDNMIYDIIPVVPQAVDTTTVNATIFTADCGALPSAVEIGFQRDGEEDNMWTFDIGNGFANISINTPSESVRVFCPTLARVSDLHGH